MYCIYEITEPDGQLIPIGEAFESFDEAHDRIMELEAFHDNHNLNVPVYVLAD